MTLREELLTDLCGVVARRSAHYFDVGGKSYTERMRERGFAYADSTISALLDYFTPEAENWEAEISRDRFIKILLVEEQEFTETTIREYIAFLPSLTDEHLGPYSHLTMIAALHSYPALPNMDDYSEADDETKQRIEALLSVTSSLCMIYEEKSHDRILRMDRPVVETAESITARSLGIPLDTGSLIRINDDDLVRLIVEYPEQAEEIKRLLIDRDLTSNTSLLREIITSSTQPLREGII